MRHLLVGDGRCFIGPPGTMGDGRGRRKTAENSGKQRGTAGDHRGRRGTMGDGGGRWGTTQCRPSWSFVLTCRASFGKDGTGRRNVVRPRPAPGRTDCPVANTEIDSLKSHKSFIRNNGYRKLNVSGEALDGIGEPGVNG